MIELLELPYYRNGLEPHISERTIDYHYGKHHAAYVKNLNALISGTAFDTMELADIVRSSEGSIFNNAAQTWNHSCYWRCMTPLLEGGPFSCYLPRLHIVRGISRTVY